MEVLGVDHVAIAVKDLDRAVETFKEVLGSPPVRVEEVPEEGVRIAMFRVGGTYIELLEGTSPSSAVARFIERRGEGIHHIALRVRDVDEASRELSKRGFRVIYERPREVSAGDRRLNFIHPKSVHGVLLEIVERVREV